jgi:hypothetical protein
MFAVKMPNLWQFVIAAVTIPIPPEDLPSDLNSMGGPADAENE